ncbi:MAG: hypothetical protein ACPG31_04205 [Planctomycetota bacterium]
MPDSMIPLAFNGLWICLVFLPGFLRAVMRRRMRRCDHPIVLHPRLWAPWMIGSWAVSIGSLFWVKSVDDVSAYPWGYAAVLGGGAIVGYLGQFFLESFTQRIVVLGTTPAAVEDAVRDALQFMKLRIKRKGKSWIIEDPACTVEVQKGSQPGTVDVQLHGSQGQLLLLDLHDLIQEDLLSLEPLVKKKFPIPFPIIAMGIMAALAIGYGLFQEEFLKG